MKCPHCGKEHVGNPKFCPETGKKLELQVLYCANPNCDYRQPLPITAKFCPNCGKQLNANNLGFQHTNITYCRLTKVNQSEKFKIIKSNNELVSDKEFYIVTRDETHQVNAVEYKSGQFSWRGAFEETTIWIHRNIIVYEPAESVIYLLSPNGVLSKLGKYSYEDGYGLNKNYFLDGKEKFGYDIRFIDEDHILYRVGKNYVIFLINKDGSVSATHEFYEKSYNLCYGTIIGDYINFRDYSLKTVNGEYESIPGYNRCQCVGYSNDEPLFLAWNNYEEEQLCRLVDLKGNVISDKRYYPGEPISKSGLFQTEIPGNKYNVYSLKNGEIILKEIDDEAKATENSDIIKLNDNLYYSLSNKEFYISYIYCGTYYGVVSKSFNKLVFSFYALNGNLLYSFKAELNGKDPDITDRDFSDIIIYDENGSPTQFIQNPFTNELISLVSKETIYVFINENEWFLRLNSLNKRIYIHKNNAIEILDFNGNKIYSLNTILLSCEICSNGYIAFSDRREGKVGYFDLEFNRHYFIPDNKVQAASHYECGIEIADMFNNGYMLIWGAKDYVVNSNGDIVFEKNFQSSYRVIFQRLIISDYDIIDMGNAIVAHDKFLLQ